MKFVGEDYPAGQKWPKHPDDDLGSDGDELSVIDSLQELNFDAMDGSGEVETNQVDDVAIHLEKDDLQRQRQVFFHCLYEICISFCD